MEDTAELQQILRGLLISNPEVIKANRLQSDYRETEGRPFPFQKLGFSTFVDYLRSIPSTVKLEPHNSPNPDVLPIVTKASSHIDKLVSKQKKTVPKRRTSSRRGGYNGSFTRQSIPPRRRPAFQTQSMTYRPPAYSRPPLLPTPPCEEFHSDFMERILWELVKKVSSSRNGMYIKDIENYFLERYSRQELIRNGINSINDLLKHACDMVDNDGQKIFPKMTSAPALTNNNSNMSLRNGIPAGMEDCEVDYDLDEEDFWDSVSEESISNYTIKRCSQPLQNSKPEELEGGFEIEKEKSIPIDEDSFSPVMINNFKKILAKYPDGIWSTELPDKYLEEFHVPLSVSDLGYSSAIIMASYLPNVFSYQRAGSHDWKLYDASVVKQVESLHLNNEVNSGSFNEKVFVPNVIVDNIKKLVDQHPEGIRSTSLCSLYEWQYNKSLDLKTLGYDRFEDFFGILEEVITIRRVTDYYLLLPKHNMVPLNKNESNMPVDILKIPEDYSTFLGPENVLRPNDLIPNQELPPVLERGKSSDPLWELEVRIAEVMSPGLFYMILDSKFNELQNMMEDLDKFYKLEEKNYKIPVQYLTQNLHCVCLYDNSWHRAKIIEIKKDQSLKIEYIDYGTPGIVDRSEIRWLQNDFAKLPSQSICAKLIGIQPQNGEKKWSKESSHVFLDLVFNKRMLAQVYGTLTLPASTTRRENVQLELILWDTNGEKDIICNEYLVEKSLADFITKEENISEETIQLEKKTGIPVMNHLSAQPIPGDQPKQRRPPPGFEASMISEKNTFPTYPPNQNNYSQSIHFTSKIHEPVYFNQPQQDLQTNSILQIGQNSDPFFMSYLLTPKLHQNSMDIQNNQLNNVYPTFALPPNISRPHQYQPNFYSMPPTNYTPQNRFMFYPRQPCNIPQNVCPNFSEMLNQPYPKFPPGFSPNLPLPHQNITYPSQYNSWQNKTEQRSLPHQKTFIQPDATVHLTKCQSPVLPSPCISPVTSLTDPLHSLAGQPSTISLDPLCLSEPVISRPSTPLTPSSEEVANVLNLIRLDTEMSSVSNNSDGYLKTGVKEQLMEEHVESDEFYDAFSDNSVEFKDSVSSGCRKEPSESDPYSSAIDTQSSSVPTNNCDARSTPAALSDSKTIPDSWEDIEPDDTPVKSENFTGFISPTVFFYEDECENQSKEIKNTYLSPTAEKREAPVNWKDIFDPDTKNTTGVKEIIINNLATSLDKNRLKNKLLQKLEIANKLFHVVCVNNKPAVLSQEFYQQFVTMSFNTITKIMGTTKTPFTVLCKKDEPALFFELNKVDCFVGAEKKEIVKFGKVSISYLSEVPQVFAELNVHEQKVLNKLKEIAEGFNYN